MSSLSSSAVLALEAPHRKIVEIWIWDVAVLGMSAQYQIERIWCLMSGGHIMRWPKYIGVVRLVAAVLLHLHLLQFQQVLELSLSRIPFTSTCEGILVVLDLLLGDHRPKEALRRSLVIALLILPSELEAILLANIGKVNFILPKELHIWILWHFPWWIKILTWIDELIDQIGSRILIWIVGIWHLIIIHSGWTFASILLFQI